MEWKTHVVLSLSYCHHQHIYAGRESKMMWCMYLLPTLTDSYCYYSWLKLIAISWCPLSEKLLKMWLFVSMEIKNPNFWWVPLLPCYSFSSSWNVKLLIISYSTIQMRTCCVFSSSSLHIFILFSIPCHQISCFFFYMCTEKCWWYSALCFQISCFSGLFFENMQFLNYRLYILVKKALIS